LMDDHDRPTNHHLDDRLRKKIVVWDRLPFWPPPPVNASSDGEAGEGSDRKDRISFVLMTSSPSCYQSARLDIK